MDISSQMLLFVKVVERGSISAAARAVGQTPSAVSKQIGMLEDQVRHRLLNRTRSGVLPTPEGHDFYEKCKALAEKFADAKAHIQSLDGSPRGKLKIASSVAFGKSQLIPVLPKFLNAYPDVSVALDLTDRDIDIEAERFDVAICFAEQRKMSDIVVRKFMQSRRILCAAPAYLERAGHPQNFADLAQHNCLRLAGNHERNEWIWQSDAKSANFEAKGNFEGNSTDVVFRATLAGLGIARLPSYLVAAKLQSAELIRVLPEYSQQNAEIAVLFADKRNLAPRIRVFVDFLVKEFRSGPEFCLVEA
ncbi:LysR family transcriptional regulator [Roseovarius arcticus]|uniref:LysR family transcriptional regulator n=1 Tax=Roseovarius arcticus TaxID=2547404 RepID=UPI001110A885|nr:LysR family transcriptional regulator [Roseovarius arcticus]